MRTIVPPSVKKSLEALPVPPRGGRRGREEVEEDVMDEVDRRDVLRRIGKLPLDIRDKMWKEERGARRELPRIIYQPRERRDPLPIGEVTKDACLFPNRFLDSGKSCHECGVQKECVSTVKQFKSTKQLQHESNEERERMRKQYVQAE